MDVGDELERMIRLLDERYASRQTVSRIAIQTKLFRLSYNGQNMSTYIDQFTSLLSQLERMEKHAAIAESHKSPMVLASINPKCRLESTAAALQTKGIEELSWDFVATTLIVKDNAKESILFFSQNSFASGICRKNSKKGGERHHIGNNVGRNEEVESASDAGPTARVFSARNHSARSNQNTHNVPSHCEFCDKPGRTIC